VAVVAVVAAVAPVTTVAALAAFAALSPLAFTLAVADQLGLSQNGADDAHEPPYAQPRIEAKN
jgi:hypothetical protein